MNTPTTQRPTSFDLQGWDIANITTYEVVNNAIKKQKKTPVDLLHNPQNTLLSAELDGKWAAWQLIAGGSGKTLKMSCPIKSGTAKFKERKSATGDWQTLDPATTGNLTVDSTGLTVTANSNNVQGPNNFESAFGKQGMKSGKFYFEVTLFTDQGAVGVARAGASKDLFADSLSAYGYYSNGFVRSAGKTAAFSPNGGIGVPSNSANTRGERWGGSGSGFTGDTVGVAVDLDAAKIWFRGKDGKWQGVGADPASGTGETYKIDTTDLLFPAVAVGFNDKAAINFGASAFKHAVPNGFIPGWPEFVDKQAKLDGAEAHVQIELAGIPAGTNKEEMMADTAGDGTNPPATITNFTLPGATNIALADIRDALTDWFNANLVQFRNIFHIVDFSDGLAGGKFDWIKPTKSDYAVADATGNTATQSLFSILSLTEGRPAPSAIAAQIAPSIADGMPATANAIMAISPERFAQKILLDGAKSTLIGSKDADFEINALGTEITNKKKMPWQKIKLEDGTEVTPEVPAKGFKMRVEGDRIRLEFTDMSFDYPGWKLPGHETVTIGFTQFLYLELKKRDDGNHILFPTDKNPNDPKANGLPTIENLTINYKLDAKAESFEKGMLIAAVVLSVFTVGLTALSAAGWIIRAGSEAADAATQGSNNAVQNGTAMATFNQQALQPTTTAVNAAGVQYTNFAALAAGMNTNGVYAGMAQVTAVANNTAVPAVASTGMMFITKFSIGMTVLAAIAGLGTIATWTSYGVATGKHITDDDIDKINIRLTLEEFLNELLEPFDWPSAGDQWELQDAQLAHGLLLYGKFSDGVSTNPTRLLASESQKKKEK